ncbi:MAG: hypothetical protein KJ072_16850 [Verrucomicrobia bacterium]|nr:hypothetical protein [Verrucomicrobiota bacterium]
MKTPFCPPVSFCSVTHLAFWKVRWIVLALLLVSSSGHAATRWTLVSWNNLGMHCLDSDFSVFSILPPYNTVHAQLIASGTTTQLADDPAGITLTYEALADPAGSINTSSDGKANFWEYAPALFGANLAPDTGLPVPGPDSYHMPGPANAPQAMAFESTFSWWAAYGIPITPYDDAGRHNPYPLLRIVARDASGTELASARVVTPVSDEMDCKLCHVSGGSSAAEPLSGWVFEPEQGRDYRLNILRLHDELHSGSSDYGTVLAAAGLNPDGLFASVVEDGHPILCAVCHLSEALPGSGQPGIKPLTEAVHGLHGPVKDPRNGMRLEEAGNRMACYACHPGSTTRCLRGAMGKAVASDGSMAMQCQSCHGTMSEVGAATRTGWLDEPNCQACHSGDAVNNSGRIRFTNAFDQPGHLRVPVNARFATTPDAPSTGISLYRFSVGHGGLQCSACHGSTHAEYPAASVNDNLQSQDHQGHVGVLAECTACHANQPTTVSGGPHGMHPIGNTWSSQHGDLLESNGGRAQCRICHGLDYRGTELSRAQGDRTLQTEHYGTKTLWRGYQVGCYLCHNGPDSESANPNTPPAVSGASATLASGESLDINLPASDPNGGTLTLRIVSQPSHGTVALTGNQAVYYSDPGYSGTDSFTFAANDGSADSNLGQAILAVTEPDADGDAIPDWWCMLHFNHPLGEEADQSRPNDDPDNDGSPNFVEFGARTDPLQRTSTLRLAQITPMPAGTSVRFNTVLGRFYGIEASSEVGSRSWTPVGTNVWGRPDSAEVIDADTASQARQFYRVRVLSP